MGPFGTVLGRVLIIAVLMAGIPVPAGADGGGGGGSGGDGAALPAKPEDRDYTAAVKAIDAGKFTTAIPLLEAVIARDGKNADAYNWLGYAVRKSGDPAKAIPIYEKALAIDPKHRGAHEYLGEAYLQLKDLGKAKEHLSVLDRLCFFPCSEYRDLKKAVQAYEQNGGTLTPQAAN